MFNRSIMANRSEKAGRKATGLFKKNKAAGLPGTAASSRMTASGTSTTILEEPLIC